MGNYILDIGHNMTCFMIGSDKPDPEYVDKDTIYFRIIAFKKDTKKFYANYWYQIDGITISEITYNCRIGNYDILINLYEGVKELFTERRPDYLKYFLLVGLCEQFTPFVIPPTIVIDRDEEN